MRKKKNTDQWHPILESTESEEVWKVIHQIAESLHNPPAAWIPRERKGVEPYRLARGASLAVGSAGIALFYAYLSQIPGAEPTFAEEADRFISSSCDILETEPMLGSLYRGLSGIAWTVQHFQGILYDDESDDPESDPNGEIDRILLDHWSAPEKFDLWEGCVGLGVYALERYPNPAASELLELLIKHLDYLSTPDSKGITWFTLPKKSRRSTRSEFTKGYYDLGIAHGAAGIISFLSRVHALGISKSITGKLLEGSVAWLMAQQWETDDGSTFPQFILPPDNTPLTTPRFGFCHGELGMAAALATASECAGESSWQAKAIEIAHASIDRFNKLSQTSAFSDPCLCHGTAGLGHLFNRIYQATGVEHFKEEALKWFRHTINIQNPGTGIAGFSRMGLNEDGEMAVLYDPGFIQGAAGIGLALLAAVTPLEPKWDRVMMISGPERIKDT